MNDIQKRNDIPSAKSLSKLGITSVGCIAGGVFLLLLNLFSGPLGLIAGGAVTLLGIGSFTSKDPADKKAGSVIMAAGILTVISRARIPLLGPVSGTLLAIGAVGLFALGIWNGIKFLVGLKKRS